MPITGIEEHRKSAENAGFSAFSGQFVGKPQKKRAVNPGKTDGAPLWNLKGV